MLRYLLMDGYIQYTLNILHFCLCAEVARVVNRNDWGCGHSCLLCQPLLKDLCG